MMCRTIRPLRRRMWGSIAAATMATMATMGMSVTSKASDAKSYAAPDDKSYAKTYFKTEADPLPDDEADARAAEVRGWVSLRMTSGRYGYGSSNFTGYGHNAAEKTVRREVLGRDLGIVAPTVTMIDFTFGARPRTGFMIGGLMGVGWARPDAPAGSPSVAALYRTDQMLAVRMGIEPGAVATFGPWSFSLAATMGVRFLQVPYADLHKIEGKKGSGGAASATQGFITPRLGIELTPNPGADLEWSIGATLGTDLFRENWGHELGLSFTLRPGGPIKARPKS